MEKRKIQRTGGSSFSITLPKKWVEAHKLKEQDFVVSFQDGDSLVVLPAFVVQKQSRGKINLGELKEEELKRELIACYISGFDELTVLGEPITKEKRLVIRKTTQILTGFEIIEDSTNQVVLRNILHPEKFSFRESIDKMFLMTYSMFQDAITSISENKKGLAQDVIERDYDIDKLYFLILRQNRYLLQNKISEEKLNLSPIKTLYYEGIAIQLERISDHAVKIAQIVVDGRFVFSRKSGQILQETAQKILPLLKEAEYFVKNIDKTKAHKVLNVASKINKSIDMFSLEITKQGSARAGILSDSLDRLYGYIRNMAELTIDQSMVKMDELKGQGFEI
jgi:phosphate uptake regulator